MNILIVAPEQIPVPPVLGGSVEITILAIARKLARRHRVTIVSRTHSGYSSYSLLDGVHIHRVPAPSSSAYVRNVIRFMRGKTYDRVQVDNRPKFAAAIRGAFPHAKILLFLHSLTFVSKPYAGKKAARLGLRKSDLVIANSSSLQSRLADRFPEARAKLRQVYLGVDTARFRPAEREPAASPFRVLFAGRLIPRKGLAVLLRAVRLLRSESSRPIKVIVAGGSMQKGYSHRMRGLARTLGVRAEFLGTVPHRRIHKVFRNAHVFVCPSQKHEAFGLVNVEAMASGIPVIASDIGGIGEIVRHRRNGLLIKDYRNPRSFAGAIRTLMTDEGLYRSMKASARQTALSRFGWDATARKLERIYSF